MCAICLIENATEIVKKFTKFFSALTELVHANHTRAKPTKEQSQTLSNATKHYNTKQLTNEKKFTKNFLKSVDN